MPYRPRRQRDIDRMHRAGARARRDGNTAFAQALAQIEAGFDEAAVVNAFKIDIERLLRLGPRHGAVRARFAARAALLAGRDLDAAIANVERWWRDERKAYQIASALGIGTRLSLDVLGELRLILRLLRFKQMAAQYHEAIAAISPRPLAEAAE